MIRLRLPLLLLLLPGMAFAQSHATHTPPTAVTETAAADPLAPLDFLVGTWTAVTNAPAGSAGAAASGTYTFRRDVGGHALVRTGSLDSCKGPTAFDCDHHDMFTAFADASGATMHGATLFAFYLDNEGHVIYYKASLPDPHTVVFDSVGAPNGPKFRLTYHLEGQGPKSVMTGKFQMAAPGSDEFRSYLEWSGTRVN